MKGKIFGLVDSDEIDFEKQLTIRIRQWWQEVVQTWCNAFSLQWTVVPFEGSYIISV